MLPLAPGATEVSTHGSLQHGCGTGQVAAGLLRQIVGSYGREETVNSAIEGKLLVFWYTTFSSPPGPQFISAQFVLYLVFINNSEEFE